MHDKFIDALRTGNVKGRTRVILEDIVTRRRIISEDENMITSALQKIFDTNMNGMTDFYNMIPIKNIMGGHFLFWDPLTEDVGNMYPPSQATNKLTGHAGQTTHSSQSTTRGNPNGIASYVDAANGQVRFAWDYSLEQGNGQISCVCLTNPGAGDAGLYPDGTLPLLKSYGPAINDLTYFGGTTGGSLVYSERWANTVPVKINDNGTGICLYLSGTTFKENVVRHPWVRSNLIEGIAKANEDNYTVVSTRSATLSRSYNWEYSLIGQDDSYYYIMERDSSTASRLYVNIVAKSDFSVNSMTIDLSGATLARTLVRKNCVNNGIISGGYIYWVSGSDSKTFVRINIQTPADTEVLTSYLSANIDLNAQPITKTAGLVLGNNYLINGDYIYPVAARSKRSSENLTQEDAMAFFKNSPLICQTALVYDDAGWNHYSEGPVLYMPALLSINNLSQPVTKTSNRTCRVEYTLTLTGGN